MSESPSLVGSWMSLIRRRWRTGLLVFAGVLLPAAALLLLARPIYRSEASLRLGEPPPPGGVSPSSGVFSFLQLGGDPFANDLELLGSRTLAEFLVDRAALNVALDAPRGWHRDSLVSELRTTRDTERGAYEVHRRNGRYRVIRTAPSDSLVGEFAPGVPAVFGGLTVTFLPPRDGMPESWGLATIPYREAVRRTRSALHVERPRREANVVALAYQHPDPALADAVVAAAVEGFMRLRTTILQRESSETMDSLRAVASGTAAELRRAEESLRALQEEALVVAPEAQSAALVERQSELVSRLARATAERAAVDEMLLRLEETRGSDLGWTSLLSYPPFLESQTLGELLTELTTLHARRAELRTRRSADTREIRALDQQIEYLNASLQGMAAEYRTGLDAQIATLRPQAAQLDATLGSLPGLATELGRRQREVRILTEVVVVTEQRLRQEELRDALTYANVQVIDPPELLARPVWPRKKLGLAIALVLSSAVALLGMVVRDQTDRRLHVGPDVDVPRPEARAAWG